MFKILNHKIRKYMMFIVKIVLSFTLVSAGCIVRFFSEKAFNNSKFKDKAKNVRSSRKRVITNLNYIYLGISIVSIVLLGLYHWLELNHSQINISLFFVVLWGFFLLSRANEIFYAFLHDAFDKLSKKKSNSSLSNLDRLKLSLNSYLELILNFAIFYFIVPCEFWKAGASVDNVAEAIYFSGVTITTLGYGDITATHPVLQLITVYEVFCGFILLIVAFAMYTQKES